MQRNGYDSRRRLIRFSERMRYALCREPGDESSNCPSAAGCGDEKYAVNHRFCSKNSFIPTHGYDITSHTSPRNIPIVNKAIAPESPANGMAAATGLCVVLLILILLCLMTPDTVMATSFTSDDWNAIQTVDTSAAPVDTVFENIIMLMTSTTGKAIVTVTVISLGMTTLLGKISMDRAMLLVIGITLVFGASSLISSLGANSAAGGQIASVTSPGLPTGGLQSPSDVKSFVGENN